MVCGEMLNQREIGEHDLLDNVGERRMVGEIFGEKRETFADKRDELVSHIRDGCNNPF